MLLFYHERRKDLHDSKQIWKKLENLRLCENGVDYPPKFSFEKLYAHFIHLSFDPQASSSTDYLEGLSIPEDCFPRFFEVFFEDVKRTMCNFTTQARGSDDIP